MTRAFTADTHRIALDLQALLRDTDPARIQGELGISARARLEELRARIGDLLDARPPQPPSVWSRMSELATLLEQHTPALYTQDDYQEAWSSLHDSLLAAYERLVAALPDTASPAANPPLAAPPRQAVAPSRPSNYRRNLVHAASGVAVILLVELVLTTPALRIGVSGAGVLWAASMEIGRRVDPRINALLMRILGPIAHPHEHHSVNSATWYTCALLILALCFDLMTGAVALAVLAFGDPVAAIVGKRFGRHRLVNGRSLEGSSAFVLAAGLAALAVIRIWHPSLSIPLSLAVAGGAAFCGALAELFTRRIDDNLSIPIAAALGASLMMWTLT